jgi:hypothetical protein
MSDVIAQDSIARNVQSDQIDDSHFYAEFGIGDEDGAKSRKTSSDPTTTPYVSTETSTGLTATPADPTWKSTSGPAATSAEPVTKIPDPAGVEFINEDQYLPAVIQFQNMDAFVATHANEFQNLAAKDLSDKKYLCCCC